jgi:hypothetical protein
MISGDRLSNSSDSIVQPTPACTRGLNTGVWKPARARAVARVRLDRHVAEAALDLASRVGPEQILALDPGQRADPRLPAAAVALVRVGRAQIDRHRVERERPARDRVAGPGARLEQGDRIDAEAAAQPELARRRLRERDLDADHRGLALGRLDLDRREPRHRVELALGLRDRLVRVAVALRELDARAHRLGELALDAGHLDLAERALRAEVVVELHDRDPVRLVRVDRAVELRVRVARVLRHAEQARLGELVDRVVERRAIWKRQRGADLRDRQVRIFGDPRDHDARRRALALLDRVDHRRRIVGALDARAHVDPEVAAAQVLAADPVLVELDQVRIRRPLALLRALQGEAGGQVLVLDLLVALDVDLLQVLVARLARPRLLAAGGEARRRDDDRGEAHDRGSAKHDFLRGVRGWRAWSARRVEVVALALRLVAQDHDEHRDRDHREHHRRDLADRRAGQEHHGDQHREHHREERGQADHPVGDPIGLAVEVLVRRELRVIAHRVVRLVADVRLMEEWLLGHGTPPHQPRRPATAR